MTKSCSPLLFQSLVYGIWPSMVFNLYLCSGNGIQYFIWWLQRCFFLWLQESCKLPLPGIKFMSPALEGEFLSIVPLYKEKSSPRNLSPNPPSHPASSPPTQSSPTPPRLHYSAWSFLHLCLLPTHSWPHTPTLSGSPLCDLHYLSQLSIELQSFLLSWT